MIARLALGICGASGRMGRTLQRLAGEGDRFRPAALIRAVDDWKAAPALDVVVDFSTPAGFGAALAHCAAHGVPLVSGTTGLDGSAQDALAAAARTIPVMHAANFSLGIAVLARILRTAAAALPGWDLEILEAHHAAKRDAPSGTALTLGRAAAVARGQDFGSVAVRARDGDVGPRPPGAIGFASIRAGDIVGEHTAILAAPGERLELSHRATDRAIFARGALAAAAWLVGQPAGAYPLDAMLAGASA